MNKHASNILRKLNAALLSRESGAYKLFKALMEAGGKVDSPLKLLNEKEWGGKPWLRSQERKNLLLLLEQSLIEVDLPITETSKIEVTETGQDYWNNQTAQDSQRLDKLSDIAEKLTSNMELAAANLASKSSVEELFAEGIMRKGPYSSWDRDNFYQAIIYTCLFTPFSQGSSKQTGFHNLTIVGTPDGVWRLSPESLKVGFMESVGLMEAYISPQEVEKITRLPRSLADTFLGQVRSSLNVLMEALATVIATPQSQQYLTTKCPYTWIDDEISMKRYEDEYGSGNFFVKPDPNNPKFLSEELNY